jgi:O-antigen/teichoic acid export membrane protein/serine acetyltransferase
MSRGARIARNTAFLMAGQVTTWAFSLLYIVIVPRAIGPYALGQLSLAAAISSIAAALLGLSLNTLLVKEIARDTTRAADFISTALVVRFLLAAPLMLLVAGITFAASYDDQTRLVIAIVTVGTLISFLTAPFSAGLMALEKMHFTTFADIVNNGLVSLAVIVLIWFAVVDAPDIALVGLGATLVAGMLQTIWLARSVRIRLRFDWPLMRSLVIGSLPFALTYVFLSVYVWIDSLMLSFMTTTVVVGWYGAATRLFAALLFVPTTVTTALLPALSHSFKHNRADAARLVHQSFTLVASLSLPIAAATVLLAPATVRLLYGPEYAPSGTVLIVLGVTAMPTYISVLVNQVLVASDRQVVWTRVMGVMCIINPAINLVAITYFQRTYANGALGAAYALLATEILMAVVALRLLPRGVLRWNVLGPLSRSALATALMGACVWLLRDRFLLVPIVAGTLVYLSAALVLRVFSPEELALIGQVGAKVTRRLGLRGRASSSAAGALTNPPTGSRKARLGLFGAFAQDLHAWKRIGFLGQPGDDEKLRPLEVARLLWAYPGVRATLNYRLSARAFQLHIPLLPGIFARHNVRRYGLDIVPSVPIGPGLYIPHPVGVVIMARAIGRNCHIISGVTIGMRKLHEFPVISDDVFIGAGARVLGDLRVGDGAHIGANAVVLGDVPAGATAVGVPARILLPRRDRKPEVSPEEGELIPALASTHSASNGAGNGHSHVEIG